MKRTLVELYALAVCFVALVCFTVALGIGVYDLIQITSPEFTLSSHTHDRHQSNEEFSKYWPKDRALPPVEELTRLREREYQTALESEKRSAFQSLTMILIVVCIDIVVFAVHWFMARRARVMNSTC